MNQSQITELRAYIQGDTNLRNMALVGQDNDIVEEINSRTAIHIQKLYMIGERGIMSTLGIVDGNIFLDSLDAFAAETLTSEHPLYAYHPGIKRAVKWLYNQGLDIGDPLTRSMLDTLASAGIITSSAASLIKADAEKTISYPESRGWNNISSFDVAVAIRDDQGNLLIT